MRLLQKHKNVWVPKNTWDETNVCILCRYEEVVHSLVKIQARTTGIYEHETEFSSLHQHDYRYCLKNRLITLNIYFFAIRKALPCHRANFNSIAN